MKLDRAFLLANFMIILVSVAAHEVASGGFAFFVVSAGVCAVVWHFHNRGRPLDLSDTFSTLVLVAVFLFSVYRGMDVSSLAQMQILEISIPAIGQFLIVFQWVYLLRKRRPRDYVWIYLVSVVHMGTAGLLMPGLGYGFFFLLYAMAAILALSTYNTWLEVLRTGGGEAAKVHVRGRAFLTPLPAAIVLMVPVALVFMALPRRSAGVPLAPRLVGFTVQPVTGFSERVELGDIGEIQENPRRVMLVEVVDLEAGERRAMPGLLLRGIALHRYTRTGNRWFWDVSKQYGQWDRFGGPGRGSVEALYRRTFPGFDRSAHRRIQCKITLEPLRPRLLFVPFAAERVELPPGRVLLGHDRTYALACSPASDQPMEYTVVSRQFSPEDVSVTSPIEAHPVSLLRICLELPVGLSPRLRELALNISPAAECPDDYSKAARIQQYLSDSQRFTYSLSSTPTPGVEPVEDFLFNTREGHCEYFAAAMVILLRYAGVPARVVNGFKVHEWNPLGGYHVVRQSDAHSWVEAYLRPGGWRTFDPSVLRDEAIPQPMFILRWWRNLYDWADTLWARHVLTYDAERQAVVYGAVARVGGLLHDLWVSAIVLAGVDSLDFGGSFWRGLVGIVKMLIRWALILGAFVIAVRLIASAMRRRGAPGRSRLPVRPGMGLYRRMERLLARRGFRRRPWQTPWEFHDELAARGWPLMEPVAAITRGFCAARYGGRTLTAVRLGAMRHALHEISRKQPVSGRARDGNDLSRHYPRSR